MERNDMTERAGAPAGRAYEIGAAGICRPEKMRERMRVMAFFQAYSCRDLLLLGPGGHPLVVAGG